MYRRPARLISLSLYTFYRYKNAMEEGGVEAWLDKNRRIPNQKNRLDARIEKRVCEMAVENPAAERLFVCKLV